MGIYKRILKKGNNSVTPESTFTKKMSCTFPLHRDLVKQVYLDDLKTVERVGERKRSLYGYIIILKKGVTLYIPWVWPHKNMSSTATFHSLVGCIISIKEGNNYLTCSFI